MDSSSYYVGVPDMSKLLPGRSRRDVLQDLRWRSASVEMADLDGKSICAVTLAFFAPNNREAGIWFHAIFVDDVLLKLIRHLPGETEEVPYQGTTSLRAKPVTVGDRSWLVRALDAPGVSVEELETEARTKVDGAHDQVDIGLTIVALVLGPALRLRTKSPSMADYGRNIKLRNQFNALRLEIGMTASEVEGVFHARPLEVGSLGDNSFSVYGSKESFDFGGPPWTTLGVHFSNVLVVFTDGRVSTVHSVSAKGEWRRNLEERFLDLPR